MGIALLLGGAIAALVFSTLFLCTDGGISIYAYKRYKKNRSSFRQPPVGVGRSTAGIPDETRREVNRYRALYLAKQTGIVLLVFTSIHLQLYWFLLLKTRFEGEIIGTLFIMSGAALPLLLLLFFYPLFPELLGVVARSIHYGIPERLYSKENCYTTEALIAASQNYSTERKEDLKQVYSVAFGEQLFRLWILRCLLFVASPVYYFTMHVALDRVPVQPWVTYYQENFFSLNWLLFKTALGIYTIIYLWQCWNALQRVKELIPIQNRSVESVDMIHDSSVS